MRSAFRRSKQFKTRSQSNRSAFSRSLKLESLEQRQLLAAEVLQATSGNLALEGGLFVTPVWIAAHDGTFDVGTIDESASGFGDHHDFMARS